MTSSTIQALTEVALKVPEIYLPGSSCDYHKFAVIACDQFSSQPEYWQSVKNIVGDSPSALNLMLPEAHLGENDEANISKINATMKSYLDNGTLISAGECFIYLKRSTSSGVRQGLVVAVDLEAYDYNKGSSSMIRATEGTIVDRLPPRIKIRKDAPLEMSHIMILINDKQNKLMGTLERKAEQLTKMYDFELMEQGGNITGYKIDKDEQFLEIAHTLAQLKQQGGDNFLYAVGDGNHSLATAKACWEAVKLTLTQKEQENHPARYALVELVNLFDKALAFEPIHRVLFNVDKAQIEEELDIDTTNPPPLEILQPKLDAYLEAHSQTKIDYIHGKEDAKKLGSKPGCIYITFDKFEKDTLFDIVRNFGALPRKSFSMGQARDKRYYLECRKIAK